MYFWCMRMPIEGQKPDFWATIEQSARETVSQELPDGGAKSVIVELTWAPFFRFNTDFCATDPCASCLAVYLCI